MLTDEEIRAAVYRSFIDTGLPPTPAALADLHDEDVERVEAAFRRLAERHEIVLAPGTDLVWMAHPFSAIPTDYRVEATDGRSWWANCAWDAVAIPGLAGDCVVHERLPFDGSAFEVRVESGRVVPDHVIHFSVPARRFWDDIGST